MFESELIKSDVTAVKYFNDLILAGIGNFLNVYKSNGCFIKKYKIFDDQNVHGIEIDPQSHNILLFGGCCIQMFATYFDAGTPNLKAVNSGRISDWILSAAWLKDKFVGAVVMLNKLLIFNEKLKVLREVTCEDQSILYSAFLYHEKDADEVIVLSGTVFGEILVWLVTLSSDEQKYQTSIKLAEHKGVIFSIYYDRNSGYICSSSDDRSTILWKVASNCLGKELKTSSPKITYCQKVYGHQSRVFRSMIACNVLITTGEDSRVNIWSFDGNLLRQIPVHQGGPIWTLDSRNRNIVTGGGDCGVVVLPIFAEATVYEHRLCAENEFLKQIGILKSNNLVAVTSGGTLYYIRDEPEKIGQHIFLVKYVLLEVSKCKKLFSLSGYHGEMLIYEENSNNIKLSVAFKTPSKARINSFHWLTCATFLTCQTGGILTLWFLYRKQVHCVTNFKLPPIKDSWSTAACQASQGKYIVGDRKGNICVFALGHRDPIQVIKSAHNYLGITQIYNFNGTIVSLGRDGMLKSFTISNKMVPISKQKLPYSWPLALVDHLIIAFSGDSFVVWDSETRGTLFEHVCGGGHRSFYFNMKNDVFTFAYLKNNKIGVVKYHRKKMHPEKIDGGYHVKTVNSLKIVRSLNDDFIIVSGGEDTVLRLSVSGRDFYCPLMAIKCHLSSIRSVLCQQIGDDEYLIYSGGGRGQIICWKLVVDDDNIKNIICSEECVHYERCSSDELAESEVRIMDLTEIKYENEFLLLAASSEGDIKVFCRRVSVDSGKHTLHFLGKIFSKRKCITKICALYTHSHHILIAMSTDGNLSFWELEPLLKKTPTSNLGPFQVVNVHQSGIVSYHYNFLDNNLLLFATGGDDGSFVVTLFELIENVVGSLEFLVLSKFRNNLSHCAQVSGTCITQNYLLTASLDQKLLLFEWCVSDDKTLCCRFLKRHNSPIADIQGLECRHDERSLHIFLYGKGFEYVKYIK